MARYAGGVNRLELEAERLEGAVWGHLVGDALGVPYEFRGPETIGEVRFGASGTHGQPPGTWSDDGALMLALLDSLLAAGPDDGRPAIRFDPEDQGRRIRAWHERGVYTPDGDGAFDIGGATLAAIRALQAGVPADRSGSMKPTALGNGSLMRILPVALAGRRRDDATLVAWASAASAVTHGGLPL
jgi:ADP-ribosylglycohydrolase